MPAGSSKWTSTVWCPSRCSSLILPFVLGRAASKHSNTWAAFRVSDTASKTPDPRRQLKFYRYIERTAWLAPVWPFISLLLSRAGPVSLTAEILMV
jgi:hypothetical protein